MENLKMKIACFYEIRFFKPWQIPVSIAEEDPGWFHNFNSESHIFKDNNGIYNGIRCKDLMTGIHIPCEKIICPDNCPILEKFYEELKKLDFNKLLWWFKNLAINIKNIEKLDEQPEIILVMNEVPGGVCNKGIPIKKYFLEHNIILENFSILME